MVALPGLILVCTKEYRSVLKSTLIQWVGGLVLCLLFSTFININENLDASDHIKPILYVFLFVIAYSIADRRRPDLNRQILNAVVVVASVAAIYTIYKFYGPRDWAWGRRLNGLGGVTNPIWISGIYAAAVVFSLSKFSMGQSRSSYLYLLLALPCVAAVWLSQSRGPLIGLAAAIVVMAVLIRNRRATALLLTGVVALMLLAGYFLMSDDVTRYLRAPEHRFTIWMNAIEAFMKAPVFGHGLHVDTSNISGSKAMQHYHNVYLTLAVQGGVVSVLAFLGLAAVSLFRKVDRDSLPFKGLLVLGMVYMLSNGDALFTSPKELWLIFWLPIVALWANSRSPATDS